MFPRELGSSTDKYRCLCTEKEFDVKFVWLFRYGSYLGDFVEARYCELIMLFGIDCSFFFGGRPAKYLLVCIWQDKVAI